MGSRARVVVEAGFRLGGSMLAYWMADVWAVVVIIGWSLICGVLEFQVR